VFRLLPAEDGARDARYDESLIELAAVHGPHACIWEAGQGLVVPRTYQRFAGFAKACANFAARGWPITVRQSGGGIVPQGPGIVNLSLAYPLEGKPLDHSDEAYLLICRLIGQALEEHGVTAQPQAVEGSFCDGRYNMAVVSDKQARKIAGTAQLWRRHRSAALQEYRQVVLVHALILASADVDMVTMQANSFELALGNDRHYTPDSTVTLARLYGTGRNPHELTESLKQSLARKIAAV
jgi:lipoate-protein ligase A